MYLPVRAPKKCPVQIAPAKVDFLSEVEYILTAVVVYILTAGTLM